MASPGAPSSSSPNDKLILVIDDDNNIRAVLTMCLTMAGFRVITAVDGLDAATKLERKPPDLIVSDLMMPGQGGYDFLRTLSGLGGGHAPVFVVTGSSLDASTINVIMSESGALEFFKKPVKMPDFIAAVHRHLKTIPQ